MKNETIINTLLLKDQVYKYLRDEIHKGNLPADAVINMDATSKKLGISKTPLRDALLQLEIEGFVTIAPRKGIYVNAITIEEIKEYYQVIGALESTAITMAFEQIKVSDIDKMDKLNSIMEKALEKNNFDRFYEKNVEFHDIYITLTKNHTLIKVIHNLKKRLYDFIPQDRWIKEWEIFSIGEHNMIMDALKSKDLKAAIYAIQDVHWSFKTQEKFIRQYYYNHNESKK